MENNATILISVTHLNKSSLGVLIIVKSIKGFEVKRPENCKSRKTELRSCPRRAALREGELGWSELGDRAAKHHQRPGLPGKRCSHITSERKGLRSDFRFLYGFVQRASLSACLFCICVHVGSPYTPISWQAYTVFAGV